MVSVPKVGITEDADYDLVMLVLLLYHIVTLIQEDTAHIVYMGTHWKIRIVSRISFLTPIALRTQQRTPVDSTFVAVAHQDP